MKTINKLYIFTVFISLTFAQFDWTENGVPLRQGVHIEWQRTGDKTPEGDLIFAWSDTRNGIRDVFAQKVNVNGEKLWGPEGIQVVIAEGRQEDPILISDNNGGAFVIWADYKNEPDTEGDVYGQHILSDGTLAWDSAGLPLTNKSGRQTSLNMCSDGEGGVFAIWKDYEPSSYGHIYGTHISAEGTILNQGEGFPIVAYPSYKGYASLENAGPGFSVLIWQDARYGNGNGQWDEGEPFTDDNENGIWDEGESYQELNGEDLFAQRISSNGSELVIQWSTPEEGGKHVCSALKDQTSPRVTHFNGFTTAIVWQDNRTNGLVGNANSDIYIQFLNESGNPILAENGIPISEGSWVKQLPRVKTDGTFAFVVWEEDQNMNSFDISGQKLDINGTISWEDNGREIVSYEGKQEQVRLTPDGLGGVYITWEDNRETRSTENDIYLQHIDASENELVENGLAICSAANLQRAPLLKQDGAGGVYILWEDQRSGSAAVFMQHLSETQEISFQENGEEQFYGIGTDGGGHSYSMGSLYMGGDENLVYWLDHRSGSLTYGQKITSEFGSEPINNGISMCMDPNQSETKIVKNDSNLLLGYLNNQADQLASYQMLDLNLNPINGDLGLQVESTSDYQPYFDTVVDEYGNFYYGYSKQLDFGPYYNDIFLQKFDSDGNPLWSTPIQVTERWGEDNVKSIHPLSGGGCILIYEAGSFTGISLKSIAVDGDGNIAEGWGNGPIDLTNMSNIFQYYEDSFHTNNYVFVSWKDTRGNGYDVYGQFLGMDGTILGNAEGIVVAGYPNDQDNSTVALNSSGNEILVCWEDNQFGDDTDILCSSISTSDHSIGDLVYVANSNDEEMSPYLFPSETGSYLITWENRVGGLDSDIFYQEINNGVGVHDENGLSVCDVPFDQTNPKIGLYSESSNSYIIYWDDKRSTGKAELTNIFCQSVTIESEQGLMISYLDDWNIVGLPLIPPDVYYTEVFPDAIPGTMYSFNGSYTPSQELVLGEGYWLRFNQSGTTTLTGTIVEEYTRELMEDWNLISVLDQPMDVEQIGDPENIIIPGTIYGFSEAYEPSSLLVPGKGYWIRTTQAGEITFYSNPSTQRFSKTIDNDDVNTLEINGVVLYFGINVQESKKLQYSLPPKPPMGAFDVRFSGGWTYPEESNIIEVMHKGLPLNLSYNIKESNEKNEKWKLVNLETNETFRLSVGTGEILLPPANQYRLEKWDSTMPEAFSLSQNFPNPFNPKTNIMFDVPVESHINVTVFDVTGRMVNILVDDIKNPGSHTVSWDGLDVNNQILPSGVYLYSIKAGQFHDVKKMIFVK